MTLSMPTCTEEVPTCAPTSSVQGSESTLRILGVQLGSSRLFLKDGGIAPRQENGHTKQSRYAHQGSFYFPTKEKKRRPCGTIFNWLARFCNRKSGESYAPGFRGQVDGQEYVPTLRRRKTTHQGLILADDPEYFHSWKGITAVDSLPQIPMRRMR